MRILGISAWYHDSAACLIEDGKIVAAAQEERFTRKKHDASFPTKAVKYCLAKANITPSEIDAIVYYEKPFLKFERILETYLAFAPRGFKSFITAMPLWIKEKLFQKKKLIDALEDSLDKNVNWKEKLLFSEHHLSHAASAFFPSPFDTAAVLTLDGVGEWTTTSLAIGRKNKLEVIKEIHFPHSIGLLYSAFTFYTGFKVNSGEYKVMGLAPYGKPTYADTIRNNLIEIQEDGSFQLNMEYFDYCTGLTMTNRKFHELFGAPPRNRESKLTQRDMDLAASIQKVTEEVILKLARSISQTTGEKNLCLAGGVALNCVVNGILLREKIFDNIWIQPAAGDAGGALGAALSVYHMMHNRPRIVKAGMDGMQGSYLGPEFTNTDIESALSKIGANYTKLSDKELVEQTAQALGNGKAIGWMQGRMEFGPRALGGRSIIADPRSPLMQKQLNLKVKYRESFRPFAPSILKEHTQEWFDIDTDSPYMLFVANVIESKHLNLTEQPGLSGTDNINTPRTEIPAVTHIDYSARVQTVDKDTNPRYHALITRFNEITGCPLVVNTSFNVRGEPIVCTPEDAFNCFMGTELDALSIGNFMLLKEDQNPNLCGKYENKYEAD